MKPLRLKYGCVVSIIGVGGPEMGMEIRRVVSDGAPLLSQLASELGLNEETVKVAYVMTRPGNPSKLLSSREKVMLVSLVETTVQFR